jgi:hypothetical protein
LCNDGTVVVSDDGTIAGGVVAVFRQLLAQRWRMVDNVGGWSASDNDSGDNDRANDGGNGTNNDTATGPILAPPHRLLKGSQLLQSSYQYLAGTS